MTRDTVVTIMVEAMQLGAKVALPLLAASLVIGLLVSVFQAVTQIQEMSLAFIPKLVATAAVCIFAGPWMLDLLTGWTTDLWQMIPDIAGQ